YVRHALRVSFSKVMHEILETIDEHVLPRFLRSNRKATHVGDIPTGRNNIPRHDRDSIGGNQSRLEQCRKARRISYALHIDQKIRSLLDRNNLKRPSLVSVNAT